MKNHLFHIHTTLFVVISLVLSSCFGDGDCNTDKDAVVKINFRDLVDLTQDTVVFDSVRIEGLDVTFFVGDEDTVRSPISFPFDPENESMKILFYERRELLGTVLRSTDTLYLNYTIKPQLLGADCGVILSYEGLEATLGSSDRNSRAIAEVADEIIEKEIEVNVNIFK